MNFLDKFKGKFLKEFFQNPIYVDKYYLERKTFRKTNGKYDPKLPRIFQIGHNRTGTTSIHKLFDQSGYKTLDHEEGLLSYKIIQNFLSGSELLSGIEEVQLYTDMESILSCAYNLFPQLDLQYPGSLFIYNYRNIEDWLVSRKNLHKGNYLQEKKNILKKEYKVNLNSDEDVFKYWRELYIRHDYCIKKYFKNKTNIIYLNLDSKESIKNFCIKLNELGFKIKSLDLPHYNKSILA